MKITSDKGYWSGANTYEPHSLDKQFILREHHKRKAKRLHHSELARELIPALRLWISECLFFVCVLALGLSCCSSGDASAVQAQSKLDDGTFCAMDTDDGPDPFGNVVIIFNMDCVTLKHGRLTNQSWANDHAEQWSV